MHRLPGDEVFHFYLGDPVEMLQLYPDGTGEVITIGSDVAAGMRPQMLVPGGSWQGSRLVTEKGTGTLRTVATRNVNNEIREPVPFSDSHSRPDGAYALLGATMAPGFDFADYTAGKRSELIATYPDYADLITALTAE